ncbi:MAG: hypothetical protein AB7P52_09610 [Alphaproteobacteria bacterium]
MIRWLLDRLALLCLLVTLGVVGNELWQAATAGLGYRVIPLWELWGAIHEESLDGVQVQVEGTSPWLWRTIVLPILLGPAWAVPLGLALLFRILAAFAPRRGRDDGRAVRKPRVPTWQRRAPAPKAPDTASDIEALAEPWPRSPWRRSAAQPTPPKPAKSTTPIDLPKDMKPPLRKAAPSGRRRPTVTRHP